MSRITNAAQLNPTAIIEAAWAYCPDCGPQANAWLEEARATLLRLEDICDPTVHEYISRQLWDQAADYVRDQCGCRRTAYVPDHYREYPHDIEDLSSLPDPSDCQWYVITTAGAHDLTADTIEDFGGDFPLELLNQPKTFRITLSIAGTASLAVKALTADDAVKAALQLDDTYIKELMKADRVFDLMPNVARTDDGVGASLLPDIEVIHGETVHQTPAPTSAEYCLECARMVAVPLNFRPLACPRCRTPVTPCAQCSTRWEPPLCNDCPPLPLTAIFRKFPDNGAWTDDQIQHLAVVTT